MTSSYIRVPHLDPRADAAAYAVARAYRQFLDDLRDGTSHVPDFAHGVVRQRSTADAVMEAAPAPLREVRGQASIQPYPSPESASGNARSGL
ncbi:hypothetical protein ACFW20_10875 [Streptomyces nigra]|uniref:hypothetical protein n=1 Tax=Streptomyces nigra TaxID=1827580 RepID=UPI003627FD58